MQCFKLFLLERGVQVTTYDFGFMDRGKVKTKHDRAELRMRALQFTAGIDVSYNRQFRGKNLTKT
jgi:hypothetical protein